jgi:hypothetical protein
MEYPAAKPIENADAVRFFLRRLSCRVLNPTALFSYLLRHSDLNF